MQQSIFPGKELKSKVGQDTVFKFDPTGKESPPVEGLKVLDKACWLYSQRKLGKRLNRELRERALVQP